MPIQPYARVGDGRLCYGPCCHSDDDLCLCVRFGSEVRSAGYHPVPSQRRRDVVCLVLGREPGSLIPVVSDEPHPECVQMWDVEALAAGVIEVVCEVPVASWGALVGVLSNPNYSYQPEIRTDPEGGGVVYRWDDSVEDIEGPTAPIDPIDPSPGVGPSPGVAADPAAAFNHLPVHARGLAAAIERLNGPTIEPTEYQWLLRNPQSGRYYPVVSHRDPFAGISHADTKAAGPPVDDSDRDPFGPPVDDSDQDTCPQCGDLLSFGYGLAGGGMGSYSICLNDDCTHFQKVQDRDDFDPDE